MEYWDVYDENRNKTNKVIQRGTPLQQGEYHLVVHVCIFNSKNELLIQKRTASKKKWPSLWDVSVGGCATTTDTSRQAALREVQEELGLDLSMYIQRPTLTVHYENGFDDYYLVQVDVDHFILQEEEVEEVRWVSEKELQSLVKEGLFIPYRLSFLKTLFEMKYYSGAILDHYIAVEDE